MSKNHWKSKKLYDHPAEHRRGTWGNVIQGAAGVYAFQVGVCRMSCPQDWAARIHAGESEDVGPGRPEIGTVRLPAIAVPDRLSKKLLARAEKVGLSVPDARREAYEGFVRGLNNGNQVEVE